MTILSAVPERKGSQRVVLVLLVLTGLLAVGCLVWGGVSAYSAYGERGQAGRFLAASRCAGSASPSGDCSAWLTRRISNYDNSKDGTDVELDGGLSVSYHPSSGWVTGLTAGESVPVLVWQGSAQALRDPEGQVLYADNSALHQGFNDIGGAVAGPAFALGLAALVFVGSPWFKRRARHIVLAVALACVGLAGFVAGITIARADSVDTGVVVGVIVFGAIIGLAALVVWRVWRKLVPTARPPGDIHPELRGTYGGR
jgi:hypothetical protein